MKLNHKNRKDENATSNETRTEHALRAFEPSYRRRFEAAKDGQAGNDCQHVSK